MRIIILSTLFLLSISCKRKRKIDVQGTVTDIYTGLPANNVKIKLYSLIEDGTSGGSGNEYEELTDYNGHFYFKKIQFSKPADRGWITIVDEIYEDINHSSSGENKEIKESEIKFIGKTNLIKNQFVICTSHLSITLNPAAYLDVQSAIFSRKFIGSNPVPESYGNFYEIGKWILHPTSWYATPDKLVGYSNGKNIIKTDYYDNNSQTTKTTYDTIISNGCGSTNNYTINLY